VPLNITLFKEPTPLIQPVSVSGCAAEVPCTLPLITECRASVLDELIIPKPVTEAPKFTTKPLAAFSVPGLTAVPSTVRLPKVAAALLFGVTAFKELMADPQPRYSELHWCGSMLFGLKEQPPAEQPALITLKSADDPQPARVLLDPAKLDSTGKTTIDFYEPSRDGKLVAVSLSQGGSEDGTLYVYEVATGRSRLHRSGVSPKRSAERLPSPTSNLPEASTTGFATLTKEIVG
jgi:hypothetical protein